MPVINLDRYTVDFALERRLALRPRSIHGIGAGDEIGLSVGAGTPDYHIVARGRVSEVRPVLFTGYGQFECHGAGRAMQMLPIPPEMLGDLARAEGFARAYDYVSHIRRTKGLPYHADVIRWEAVNGD